MIILLLPVVSPFPRQTSVCLIHSEKPTAAPIDDQTLRVWDFSVINRAKQIYLD